MQTPRERARERTMTEIHNLAWRQVEQEGAAAVSLRGIARELGIVSSAIYRYVASRDDLLTALLVEGFSDLADAVERAEAAVPRDDYRERWLTACRAMRAWALARPAAWGLLYGGPVPGYSAPQQTTSLPGARVLLCQGAVLVEAQLAGKLRPAAGSGESAVEPPAQLRAELEAAAASFQLEIDAELVALGILGWTISIAVISMEVFEHLGPDAVRARDQLAELQFATAADALGL